MSERTGGVLATLTRPADASYGTRRERLLSALTVGLLAGVVGATAAYVIRRQALAPAWADDATMAALVFASGALVKLLCQSLRTSVLALGVATVAGAVLAVATAVVPFLLLDIGALGELALLLSLRNVITLLAFGQIPLQLTGYLVAIVYDGVTA